MAATGGIPIEMVQGVTQRPVGRSSNNASTSSEGADDPQQLNDVELAETPTPNDHHLNLEETLPLFFSKGVPVVDLVLVVSFFFKMRLNKHSCWMGIVYLASFFLSFCLHVVGMSGSRCIQPIKLRGMVAYLSTVLRMLSAAALLLFLDYDLHSVAVLPPFVLAFALVAAVSCRTFCSREEVGLNWGHFKEELKLQFNLSANVVSMAFTGLAGRVLGGYAGVSVHKSRGFMAVAPECFLFYGVVLGLLQVLHCTVPTRILFYDRRRRVARVYKPLLAYAALLFLILASVVAAEDMLQVDVFFVCFCIVVVAVSYLLWRNHKHRGNGDEEEQRQPPADASASARDGREQDANISQYLQTAYFTPLFSLVMATHSKYSIDGASSTVSSLSLLFKCFLFSGLCSILIYTVRIVVFAEMRDGHRDSRAISCTTNTTFATMAITGLFFFLVFFLKLGELKNIIIS